MLACCVINLFTQKVHKASPFCPASFCFTALSIKLKNVLYYVADIVNIVDQQMAEQEYRNNLDNR